MNNVFFVDYFFLFCFVLFCFVLFYFVLVEISVVATCNESTLHKDGGQVAVIAEEDELV